MKNLLKITLKYCLIGGLIMSLFTSCNQKKEYSAIIKTNLGNMSLIFYQDIAPKAVKNFITHSKNGYYNGVTFHRVIKDFMIQGGDPSGTGMGGESIWGSTFEYEISDKVSHDYGAVAMAHSSLPNSNGSQFYIVQNKNGAHYLDGQYTVFGHLSDGYDILDTIANQPTDQNDKPLNDIIIQSIEIIEK